MSATTLHRMQTNLNYLLDNSLKEEHKNLVLQWIKDDGGVDLESFFEEDNCPDEDMIWELQVLIEDIAELKYLYNRSEKLDRLEAEVNDTVGALKEIFNRYG